MGKLAHLQDRMGEIRQELETAKRGKDIRRGELDGLLSGRFNKVSDRLNGSLDRLMAESDKVQSKTLNAAVEGVIGAVGQIHGAVTEAMAQISQEVALSHNVLVDELNTLNSGVGSSSQSVNSQLQSLSHDIGKLPTRFIQHQPDLSPVMADLRVLRDRAFPDSSAAIQALEQRILARMAERKFEFDVVRGPNNLIHKIVVTET